ncbi:MAG: hypothetical protein EA396_07275 [Anaerolineaceae bacterium]|nr:MAG: hypothetical protein EA396_07275 [Anaerolineaceae bacterium]
MTGDDLIGKKLGGYEILDRIGDGGMATVYRARQTSMNRIVALKVLPRHLMRDDQYLQRFKREVDIIAQLEHRNIVPVHDYGDDEGQPYIAMRYMPAGSVDELIRRGALSLDQVSRIIGQIAPALDYAHSKNVLHRDLKPSNVLMDDDGGAYITDFGIARILGAETRGSTITTQGVVGTPSYMSPEQAQGKKLDGRSDVYSLGVMLFEMITGSRPFESETPYSVAVLQVTAQPPDPSSINPAVPPAVEAVILKALKKLPPNRYQTAAELQQALEQAIKSPEASRITRESASTHTDESTQPSGTAHEAVNNAMTSPSPPVERTPPPVNRPQPTYPPPASRPHPSRNRVPPVRGRRRPMRRRVWVSVIIGVMLGCMLLTASLVALGMMAREILQRDAGLSPLTPIPTLDATAQAARQTMIGGEMMPSGGTDEATPIFANVTPIPTRTPAPPPDAQAIPPEQQTPFPPDFDRRERRIVYFGMSDDGAFDLFLHDLLTGENQQLTRESGNNTHPAVSPDGRLLAFRSDRGGVGSIYIMDLASREVVALTGREADDHMPGWSPDGAHIVFASDRRGDGTLDIMRVPSAGGTPQIVYSDGQRNSHPRYSPDGRRLVFVNGAPDDARTWNILTFDFADGTTRELTRNVVRDAFPSFSPDGSQVLYVTDGLGGAQIALISADGDATQTPRTLYDGIGYEWGMHYSPDAAYIIFNEEIGGRSVVRLIRADAEGDAEPINVAGIEGYYPVWLP